MDSNYLVWTALALNCRGAGAYVGFAPEVEHELVGRMLTEKQLRLFTGGTLAVQSERMSPLQYYAVRDPSCVRVKQTDRAARGDGSRHVHLMFGFARGQPARPADAAASGACDEDAVRAAAQAVATGLPAFVITIGLPTLLEEKFHQNVICADPRQTLDDLCRRVAESSGA